MKIQGLCRSYRNQRKSIILPTSVNCLNGSLSEQSKASLRKSYAAMETNGCGRSPATWSQISAVFADLEGDFVITGWIVAHNEGRFLSAERASKRLSKKTASKKDLQDNPLLFVARDLLELGRRDLSGIPLKERRQQLEELVGKEDIPSLPIAEALAGESWDGLDAQRLGSRAHQSPGIILRKRDALHSADVKTLFWPADPYSITAVLLYAQRGMQGMYSR